MPRYRSAITGKYIQKAAAMRWPKSSVCESTQVSGNTRTVHRSANTGRFVSASVVGRWPQYTLTERV